MAEDLGEKTEQPTGRRRDEARDEGQVAKSQDLSAATAAVAIVVSVYLFAGGLLSSATGLMRFSLSQDVLGTLNTNRLTTELWHAGAEIMRMVVPFMLILAAVGLATNVFQVGWRISPKALTPKLEKLNVVKGMAKLVSKRGAVKAGLDAGKLLVIGAATYVIVRSGFDQVVGLSALPVKLGVVVGAELVLRAALWVLVILVLLGLLDLTYQRWQATQDLKMTKHEVKDERKSTEGDMEVKRRRLQVARQIAMQRIAIDVPKADVIVTNPTHFAVALKYDANAETAAPRVVAKGADYLAMKIRYLAATHGIPVIERAPLARALYREVEVGQEIHPEHYEAVAEVLAYVYRLDRSIAS